eukprot:2546476-Amphidinium_carterae.1
MVFGDDDHCMDRNTATAAQFLHVLHSVQFCRMVPLTMGILVYHSCAPIRNVCTFTPTESCCGGCMHRHPVHCDVAAHLEEDEQHSAHSGPPLPMHIRCLYTVYLNMSGRPVE